MVVVDMSPARLQITKRRRRRKAQAGKRAQRAARLARAHAAELRSAREAAAARAAAVAGWHAEERRLRGARSPSAAPRGKRRRRVRFAPEVLVAQIPARAATALAAAVEAPLGDPVSVEARERAREMEEVMERVRRAPGGGQLTVADTWEEGEDDESDDPEFLPGAEAGADYEGGEDEGGEDKGRGGRPRRILPVRVASTRGAAGDAAAVNTAAGKEVAVAATSTPQATDSVPEELERQIQQAVPCNVKESSSGEETSGSVGAQADAPVKKPMRAVTRGSVANGTGTKHHGGGASTRPVLNDRNTSRKPSRAKKRKRSPDSPEQPTHEASEAVGALVDVAANAEVEKEPLLEARLAVNGQSLNGSPASARKKKKRKVANQGPELPATGDTPASLSASNDRAEVPLAVCQEEAPANGNSNGNKHETREYEDEDDIDDMFGVLVKKRAACKVEKAAQAAKQKDLDKLAKKVVNGKGKKPISHSPPRYTKDGLRIMTYEEIASDQPSGLTGECPFDCSCCY